MSGMDRMTDEALERRANTALSGLGPVHGRLMTEGYEGSANAVMDAADVIRELLAHRRASQAAPAPSDGLREAVERAAVVAECAFDDRPRDRSGHPSHMDWEDGYLEGTRAAAEAIRAALSASPAQEGGE